ncbi:MAG: hypothetical protein Q4D88_01855 [Anaerococcus sp.]|nr:hypothetical protein [Anaerococcus sp.]
MKEYLKRNKKVFIIYLILTTIMAILTSGVGLLYKSLSESAINKDYKSLGFFRSFC